MDRIFIAGVDTVAGGNMACTLDKRFEITGCALENEVTIDGRSFSVGKQIPHKQIVQSNASQVVYCGLASRTSWMTDHAVVEAAERKRVRTWARAAAAAGVSFTYVSSDGMFSGPWLYHAEDSESFAQTTLARALISLEQEVQETNPNALIVRTNCFGWSPDGDELIESILSQIEDGARRFPHRHHASMIHAGELAECIAAAWNQSATGILHIGGGQRVNQNEFAAQLAAKFGIEMKRGVAGPSRELNSPAMETAFRGERMKALLQRALPDLGSAMTRLHNEKASGFQQRFKARPARARVA